MIGLEKVDDICRISRAYNEQLIPNPVREGLPTKPEVIRPLESSHNAIRRDAEAVLRLMNSAGRLVVNSLS